MIGATSGKYAGLLGKRVFADRDIRQHLCGLELRCDSVRLTHAGSGGATRRSDYDDGNPGFVAFRNFKANNFRAGIKARHEKRSEQ
jgi:hypothetical protein